MVNYCFKTAAFRSRSFAWVFKVISGRSSWVICVSTEELGHIMVSPSGFMNIFPVTTVLRRFSVFYHSL